MTEDRKTDVCVVGAGPAGLALSLMLLRSGVRVTLVERSAGGEREFRGEILQPGGMRILDALGVLAPARDRGSTRHDGFQLLSGKRTLLDIDYRRLDPPHNLLLAIPQHHVLEELLAACRRLPGFDYLGGHRLRELLQDQGRYTGAVVDGGPAGRTTVRAGVLVGADGRFSRTRRLAGIDPGRLEAFGQDVVWFKLRAPGRAVGRVRIHRAAGQALLVYDSHPDRLQIGWTVPHGGWRQVTARGVDAVKRDLKAALPQYADLIEDQVGELRDLTLLDVFAGRARTWARDGLVLIGDAAHTHSPIGAQGINLALQDAAVLHPILLAALRGDGTGREVLARFEEARGADIDAVFRLQVRQAKAMLGRPNPVADVVRPLVAGLVGTTPLGAALTRRIALGRREIDVRGELFTIHTEPRS